MNNSPQQLDRQARQALAQLTSGTLSDAQFAALQQRLLQDPAFRRAYVEQVDLESGIENQLKSLPPSPFPPKPASRRYVGIAAFALAICILLLLTLLGSTLLRDTSISQALSSPKLEYVETRLSGQAPVAIVTKITGVMASSQSPLRPGDRMKPGVLRVEEGSVQLEFHSSAVVRISGPAEMHLLSANCATLLSGQAAAVIPPEARNFTLNGPISAIAEGPSEFTYAIQSAERCVIDVYQGAVMASLLGDSGDTLLNELVQADESAEFSGTSIDITKETFAQSDRTRVLPIDEASLSVSDQYAAAIIADQPLVYWRFEPGDQQNDLVRNHMSDRYAGRLHGLDDLSMRLDQGSLHFAPSAQPRYLKLAEPIEQLNAQDFTVEFWMRPQRMHWATIFGWLPIKQADLDRESHLCVIEYANQTNLVHRPATIRFLYRYPPTTYQGGINVFSADSCVPGMWHHIVAVKSDQGIRLYLNGKLREVSDRLSLDDFQPYTAVL
ncbi:MAG: LamG-like jellyroll fold domain-containing protein, partial [Blastopirellula sp. JB062]